MHADDHLDDYVRDTTLVSLKREDVDDMTDYGFVVGASTGFVALHYVSNRYDLDGYIVVRRGDITSLRTDFKRRALITRALEHKQLAPEAPTWLDLGSMRGLVRSVQDHEPLVVIHRELLFPDECEIGRVRIDSDQTYSLLWMDTEAQWDPDHRVFRYADITKVGFAGEYERTLAEVAGPPPEGSM